MKNLIYFNAAERLELHKKVAVMAGPLWGGVSTNARFAKTEFLRSHPLTVDKWSLMMFQYPRFKSYFSKFIGKNVKGQGIEISTSDNAMIQLKSDFKKGQGDLVHFA